MSKAALITVKAEAVTKFRLEAINSLVVAAEANVPLETFRVTKVTYSKAPFEGHTTVTFEGGWHSETRALPGEFQLYGLGARHASSDNWDGYCSMVAQSSGGEHWRGEDRDGAQLIHNFCG